jgi:LysR family transcriptional regulator for bpeEF and oprC
MDRLHAMEIFVRVVETNSFSKAADMLELPRGSVSNIVRWLEEHVGARLLNRTTRQVSLTDDGALYYERCVRILSEIADAESLLSEKRRGPTGSVRIDTSGTIAKALLLPAIEDFYRRYPNVTVRLGLTDRTIDIIQDGVDCVVRMGDLDESSLVARRIGEARLTTCASPGYLREHGTPSTLDELNRHHGVNYVSSRTGKTFPFEFIVDGEAVKIQMSGVLSVNDGSTYITAGVLGYGIIQPSRFMVADLIAQGLLQEILVSCQTPSTPLSILYPHRQNVSARVRAFMEWLAELAEHHPDLRA